MTNDSIHALFQFYNMSGFKGRVLIINVNTFKYEDERVGSDQDVGRLTECFMKLGFQVKDRSLFYPPKVCYSNLIF